MLQVILYSSCYFILWQLGFSQKFLVFNACLQFFIFVLLAHIPSLYFKRMNYVDLAWPMGLIGIGLSTFFTFDSTSMRTWVMAFPYLIAGLRMFTMAVIGLRLGAFNQEFPRYLFHIEKWKKQNKIPIVWLMQIEISVQCLANITILCLPVLLQSQRFGQDISPLEILGYGLWIVSAVLEMIADWQKHQFSQSKANKNKICRQGLWAYSRHPNYFFQWMQWNALALVSLPAVNSAATAGLLLSLPLMMYYVMVYYTGVIPSEYFSVQKRPEYKDYQQSTNRFFPLPRKSLS